LADVTTLIAAIATTRAVANSLGPITQTAVNLVADAAEATLPVDQHLEFWLLTYAFRSGTKWLPGMERFDSALAANNAATAFGKNPDYTYISVVGPFNQTVPAAA
jgi:hypothetical protein